MKFISCLAKTTLSIPLFSTVALSFWIGFSKEIWLIVFVSILDIRQRHFNFIYNLVKLIGIDYVFLLTDIESADLFSPADHKFIYLF